MIKKTTLLLYLITLSSVVLSLSNYEKGLANYNEGDYEAAEMFYKKAAEQGSSKAQFSLASMYQLGVGISENHDEACKWFYKAYEQGNDKAKYQVYLTCRGTKYYHQLRNNLQ